ncbi:MAG: bifunctional enoyl-CoA hydratase/phosphate acetyltransferase [Akkermansiaceae bacterium]|jgi:phosphate butyryltransferase|nr:bifunctional enoyl-CoA hydratase/phosphate acetyltransferase [Akkermansiaceae bacterium]
MTRIDEFVTPPEHHTPPWIAVAMANAPEVIRCIAKATRAGLARFVLIGPVARIKAVAAKHRADLGDARFIDEDNDEAACSLAARLVKDGEVRMIMKGLVPTATFSRAFLNKELELVPPGNLVSHVAFMDIPGYHKLLVMTDGGLNIDPDLKRKAAILRNAIDFCARVGIRRPKVALISAIEKVTPKMRSTTDAHDLVQMAEEGRFMDAIIDGPFGLDIALSEEAARIKGAASEVAGDADILLMPNIESGNVFYKAVTRFTPCGVAGVIAGARCPIIITSRADAETAKFRSVALAVKSVLSP